MSKTLLVEVGGTKQKVTTDAEKADDLRAQLVKDLGVSAEALLEVFDADFSEYIVSNGSEEVVDKSKWRITGGGAGVAPAGAGENGAAASQEPAEEKLADLIREIYREKGLQNDEIEGNLSEMSCVGWTLEEGLKNFLGLAKSGDFNAEELNSLKIKLQERLHTIIQSSVEADTPAEQGGAAAASGEAAAAAGGEAAAAPAKTVQEKVAEVEQANKAAEEIVALAAAHNVQKIQKLVHSYGEVDVVSPGTEPIPSGFEDFDRMKMLGNRSANQLTGEQLWLACGAEVSLEEPNKMSPTPVQQASIPLVVTGKNVIGCAETGSGKTLCFAIGALSVIDTSVKACQVLIIEPTNSLVDQAAKVIQKMCDKVGVTCGYLQRDRDLPNVGGNVPQILVGTAAQFQKFVVGKRQLPPHHIKMMVLDEVDETHHQLMESRGSSQQRGGRGGYNSDPVSEVHRALPSVQTLLYSATLPDPTDSTERELWAFMRKLAPNAFTIFSKKTVVDTIFHLNVICRGPEEKSVVMKEVLPRRKGKCLLFVSSSDRAKNVSNYINTNVQAQSVKEITGRLDLDTRKELLAHFKNPTGSVNYVVATDVLSRGVDIPFLTIVVNSDTPFDDTRSGAVMTPSRVRQSANKYLHRAGRTGRAGSRGIVINLLVQGEEVERTQALVENLRSRRRENRDILQHLVGIVNAADLIADPKTSIFSFNSTPGANAFGQHLGKAEELFTEFQSIH